MEQTKLTIQYSGQTVEVGTLHNHLHGGTSFTIPQSQDFGETGQIMIVGLQYVDFADYLLLLEAFTDEDGELFLLDIREFGENGSFTKPYELPKFEGGYKEFHQLVGSRL
ncbi:hypothetical protein P4493_06030 [Bacillus thuringiensis]|jgi:hypothetical protein|uniref:Uncharacterized protein n=3 Tax=Bacillus thuringiensis TaxID=1428 RepID=A0A0B5NCQ3_BACTU|nr:MULTISPECIES: hypothetical protein [Bacillus]MEC2533122.1 hypothetical protein [Bacillus cereus]MED1153898.1 hypothetical protein [Bacillus paranthracis]OUB09258.1 hypothetical protein BK708_32505 [Bacillus thuringiensis serovar yunnanensis]AFQ30206.1 hypothetical protein BTF1_30527 [Bacillus thuringiensis HD-789]AJG74140.1 hypothetical protein BF38_6014 [Bacillus thuringiensis]